ncbi:hypothetical protein SASPL_153526 [Salvia splendens]|uniref:Plastid division protein CDP1-like 1st alpha solenoid domain-containing protein n=1 Tax=Salvia splendens TaxID=180675 RepID=A0A8X8VYG6_SALSN|nr:hypothetical protein SASPL_153526 [Salvia splendens]
MHRKHGMHLNSEPPKFVSHKSSATQHTVSASPAADHALQQPPNKAESGGSRTLQLISRAKLLGAIDSHQRCCFVSPGLYPVFSLLTLSLVPDFCIAHIFVSFLPQDVLMDVRDKLLFEPEYAGNFKEKQPPKSSLKIPWTWFAWCFMPSSGGAFLKCAIAKVGFEKNNISQGFEALARAQCLLRSKISLGKMMLLAQIEESLEELAPACTLDLLGMSHTPENAERSIGAIAALHELLRQGLDVETSCQVQDWACFLHQALKKLLATEIVKLVPWDSLAITRKNRKSLEAQNQRIVIDFSSFYVVLLAHSALGVSSKQIDVVLIFFCYNINHGDEATAVEKLRQLELNSSPSSQKALQVKETKEVSSANKPLSFAFSLSRKHG